MFTKSEADRLFQNTTSTITIQKILVSGYPSLCLGTRIFWGHRSTINLILIFFCYFSSHVKIMEYVIILERHSAADAHHNMQVCHTYILTPCHTPFPASHHSLPKPPTSCHPGPIPSWDIPLPMPTTICRSVTETHLPIPPPNFLSPCPGKPPALSCPQVPWLFENQQPHCRCRPQFARSVTQCHSCNPVPPSMSPPVARVRKKIHRVQNWPDKI